MSATVKVGRLLLGGYGMSQIMLQTQLIVPDIVHVNIIYSIHSWNSRPNKAHSLVKPSARSYVGNFEVAV